MTTQDLAKHISNFFQQANSNGIELYNEFSLQHELGIYLRNLLQSNQYKVQFERNIAFFGIQGTTVKKEIDIVVYNDQEKFAIELKFPRNGAYPRRMFQFIKDICFVEQLSNKGFDGGCAVVLVDDKGFYSNQVREKNGIYSFFRNNAEINGDIDNPIKSKKPNQIKKLTVYGHFTANWKDTIIVDRDTATKTSQSITAKYYIIEI